MVKTLPSNAGIRGQSLVWELRSHMLRGVGEKKIGHGAARVQDAMLLVFSCCVWPIPWVWI